MEVQELIFAVHPDMTDHLRTLGNASFKLTLYGYVVSVCCIGFATLDVVCDELYESA